MKRHVNISAEFDLNVPEDFRKNSKALREMKQSITEQLKVADWSVFGSSSKQDEPLYPVNVKVKVSLKWQGG